MHPRGQKRPPPAFALTLQQTSLYHHIMAINNHDLHYKCTGSGPDVLLIHGWGSSGRMWRRLMYGLQHQARFWAVDLAGFGASPGTADLPPDVEMHTEMLAAFCVRHNLHPHAIIGHSMGGMLALKLLLKLPQLSERFVLVCPTVTGRFGTLGIDRWFATDFGRSMVSRAQPLWSLAQADLLAKLQAPRYVDNVLARARIVRDFKRASWEASAFALLSMARENLAPRLHTLRQRGLVVVGGRDTTVPPDEGRLVATLTPNARLVEFARSHHQPLDEEPERFLRVVSAFLQDLPPDTADPAHGGVVPTQTCGRINSI